MKGSVQREQPFDAAESKTLSMCGSSMRENRETPETSTPDGGAGRSEKAESRKFDVHVFGESDGLIVPTKRANKPDAQMGRGSEGTLSTRVTWMMPNSGWNGRTIDAW